MSCRALTVAAALLTLAGATGCGQAGLLAPTPTPTPSPAPTSTSRPSPTPADGPPATPPAASPLPTPTLTESAPPAPRASPPQPPVVPLPPPSPPLTEIAVDGPAALPGATYDLAIACTAPLLVWLDDRGDFAYGSAGDGPALPCSEGDALLLQQGVPGEVARPFGVVEADIGAPLIVTAEAGSGFGADAVAALASAADAPLVTVQVSCPRSFEASLAAQLGACDPLAGSLTFPQPVTVDAALTELVLPQDYAGLVQLRRLE
ncbi:hypothetical protein [Agrococcus beijingensis]|uniref:hypothetical protein n=1 Tax=Agrococcus beijingensis TaxID=3068634 RepID=UPI0027420B45|nr:hypothetical protein [Agrococcus sp. REN33]